MSQLATSAPKPGRRTWPPWVWPAKIASAPRSVKASSTRRYGAWVTPSVTTAACVVGLQLRERVGERVEPIPAAVRVADAERVDARPADIQRADRVVEVEPAELVGRGSRRAPGCRAARAATFTFDGPGEVPERIARRGRGVVVRSVDEDAGDAAQRVERAPQAAKPLGVAEVVARVDDEVGLAATASAAIQPACGAATAPCGRRRGAAPGSARCPAGRMRQLVHADREQVALDADAPDRGSGADRPHRGERGEGGAWR